MKNYLLPLVLLGIMLVAMPVMANDIPTTGTPTGMGNVTPGSDAAVKIVVDSPVAWYDSGWQAGTNPVTTNGTFNFGVLNINLTGSNAITGTATDTIYSGIHTNAHEGTFNLGKGTITIHATTTTLDNDVIRGFRHEGGTFSGTITGGTDITVIATDSFYATAVGFATRPTSDVSPGSFDNANITFGNLTAKTLLSAGGTVPSGGSGATTFRSGDFTGTGTGTHVILGTLTAETEYSGAGVAAIGAHIGTNGSNAIQSGSSLTIAGIDVTSAGSAGGLLLGNATGTLPANLGNSAGSITIGTIDVTGFGDSYGIRAKDMANLTLTGDTNVTSTNGTAYGAQIWGNITGSTNTGNITAIGGNTGNDGAAGFAAYGVNTGTITLGDIEARGNWAVGAHFTQGVGNLIIGDVEVASGQHEATGLAVGTYAGGTVSPADLTGNAVVGNVKVTSQETNAFGIRASKINNLTLNGDIAVEGAGNDTSAIRTYDSTNITLLDRDVNFSTTHTGVPGAWVGADIWSDGDLNINLNNRNLTADRVKVDGGSNLSIRGNGNANVNVVNVTGDFTIGVGADKTAVTVDGVKMLDAGASLGNVKFGDAGSLKIFGNTNDLGAIGKLDDAAQAGQIVNLSTFTKWGYNPTTQNIESFGMREQAYANDNYLAAGMIHHKYTAWNAVRNHLISGSGQVSRGYFGQAPCDCLYGCDIGCTSNCEPGKARSAWGNYVGRDARYRSSFNNNDWHLTTHGVQVGTDFFRNYKTQVGAFFGYEDSTGKNHGDRLTAKDYYVGMYGVHVFNGGVDLRTIFGYGWQDFTSRRNGADNNPYRTAFNGNTTELTVELGKRHYCGGYFGVWSVRPAIAVDWYYNQLGGGVESFGDQALRYHKTDFSQLFFRFGTDVRYEGARWAVEGGLFYSYDMQGNDYGARVSDAATGDFTSRLMSSKQGRSVLTFNLGSSYQVSRSFSLFSGYRGEVTPEQAGRGYIHTGYVGGAWRW